MSNKKFERNHNVWAGNSAVGEKFGKSKKNSKNSDKNPNPKRKIFLGLRPPSEFFWECDKCGREFRNENSVTGHKNEHKEMGAGPLYTFKCLLCKKFQTFDLRLARKHLFDGECDALPDHGRSPIRIII